MFALKTSGETPCHSQLECNDKFLQSFSKQSLERIHDVLSPNSLKYASILAANTQETQDHLYFK